MKNDTHVDTSGSATDIATGGKVAPVPHTPLPWAWEWIAEKSNEWAVGQAWHEDGTPIAGRIPDGAWIEDTVIERRLVGMNESGHASAADAEFIVRACNAHDELLAALKKLSVEVSGLLGTIEREMREAAGNTNMAVLTQRWQEARAAIAKAEGRQP
jgi:hypothetical protein